MSSTSPPPRVLVAGATGYLGQYVAREFKRQGYYVRALARDPSKLDHVKDELDEIVVGRVTALDSISSICDGMDYVFSSVGITRQNDKVTFRDVDFQGNANLLEVAKKAGVKKFMYVSVFNGPNMCHLECIKAHEDFVNQLQTSGLDYSIIRPTGYYSDMGEFFDMARHGRVYLIGAGDCRMNPIHGADLAVACVKSMRESQPEVNIGGPDVLTYSEIAGLAFEALDKPCRITSIPVWIVRVVVSVTKLISKHTGDLIEFFMTATTTDAVAPKHGTHSLKDYFKELKSH